MIASGVIVAAAAAEWWSCWAAFWIFLLVEADRKRAKTSLVGKASCSKSLGSRES